jgi:hypothetical protein
MDYYLHCQGGSNDKVYSLHLRPTDGQRWVVMGWYGPRGGTLRTRGAFKVFTTLSEARIEFDARYKQKLQHAYHDAVASAVVWPTGAHWLIGLQIVPDAEIEAVVNGATPSSTAPAGFTATAPPRPRRARPAQTPPPPQPPQPPTYTPPHQPPPVYTAPPSPRPRTSVPAIPAWILACFSEIPKPLHPQAADILSTAFPHQRPLILAGAKAPEPRPVAWMRAVFALLPTDKRKSLYYQFSKVLHIDYSHDNDLYRRWIDAYKTYSSS